MRLTEDGETYLEAARSALDGLAEAEVALAARRDEPVGRVRIARNGTYPRALTSAKDSPLEVVLPKTS